MAAWGCSMFALKHPGEALPYFSKVDDRFYRRANPSPAGFHQLAGMGIKTVINLRAEELVRQRQGRRAALVAVYRVVGQGWEPKEAYAEARKMGMSGWNPLLRHLVLPDARNRYAPMFSARPGAAAVMGEGG